MAYTELEPWEKKRKKEAEVTKAPAIERKYQEQASTQAQQNFKPPAAPKLPQISTATATGTQSVERKHQEQKKFEDQRSFTPPTPNSDRKALGRARQVEQWKNSEKTEKRTGNGRKRAAVCFLRVLRPA